MKLTVLRHGAPNININGTYSAVEFGHWIKKYNAASIDKEHQPPENTVVSLDKNSFVVCSHLPRSLESADILGFDHIDIQDSMFRECDMPYANWAFPKLSVKTWAVIFRLFQLFGYSYKAESIKEAKERADACTVRLHQYASEHQSVLFVGHGALNWLIHRQLLQKGWQGPPKSSRKHWEFSEYRFNES